jgi:hypothetical protein
LPERLHRQESYERTAAMLTLQAEADSAHKAPRQQHQQAYPANRQYDESKVQLENDSDLAIANRTLELRSSIQVYPSHNLR